MIIMVISDDSDCWDDGCKTIVIGNTLDEVIRKAKAKDLYQYIHQIFQVGSNHITTIGEVTEITDYDR